MSKQLPFEISQRLGREALERTTAGLMQPGPPEFQEGKKQMFERKGARAALRWMLASALDPNPFENGA
jgi:hypothetical protein